MGLSADSTTKNLDLGLFGGCLGRWGWFRPKSVNPRRVSSTPGKRLGESRRASQLASLGEVMTHPYKFRGVIKNISKIWVQISGRYLSQLWSGKYSHLFHCVPSGWETYTKRNIRATPDTRNNWGQPLPCPWGWASTVPPCLNLTFNCSNKDAPEPGSKTHAGLLGLYSAALGGRSPAWCKWTICAAHWWWFLTPASLLYQVLASCCRPPLRPV